MTTRGRALCICALALCFACLTSAQVTSPNGAYGILLNQWLDQSKATSALLGVRISMAPETSPERTRS